MKPVQIEDLLRYRFLSAIEFSPDARLAAFIVKKPDLDNNAYTSDLHLVDLESKETRVLTSGGKDGPFSWSPDGEIVFFLSRREEEEEKSILYGIRVDGGEAQRVGVLPHPKAGGLRALGEGRFLYTARIPLTNEHEREDAADYEVLEEIPFWMNGEGFTSQRRKHLLLFDAASGEAVDLLEPQLEAMGFDRRGDRVVVLARRFEGKAEVTSELWLVDLATCDASRVAIPELRLSEIRFLDDATLVALGSDMQPYGLNQDGEILTIDIASGAVASLTPGWNRCPGNRIAADCRHGGGPALCIAGEDIYVTITDRTHTDLIRVNPTGDVTTVARSPGSIDSYAVQDGKVLSIELRPDALQEVYLHEDGVGQALSTLNEEARADRTLAPLEAFRVSSTRGDEIDAWILRPPDLEPGASIPTVLTIHGGPRGAYSEVFFHQMQAMAGAGYAVLICNPHGSAGRGNAFADIRGEYGGIDYDDLMEVVDAAIERYPFVDGERLGVMGGSYGGFMTNWIIGQTDRFQAAVSQRSIANWVHKFCTTDIGYYFNADQLGTDPWAEGGSEKLWDFSPLKYADRAATPTLFIHSEQDYRCWLPEGIQMFTALRYHGVESRLVLFREENHELSRSGKPKHRLRRLQEIVAWFDRHLKS